MRPLVGGAGCVAAAGDHAALDRVDELEVRRGRVVLERLDLDVAVAELAAAAGLLASSAVAAESMANLYWNPEQPPPSTASRSMAGLPCFSAMAATRRAAEGLRVTVGVSISGM